MSRFNHLEFSDGPEHSFDAANQRAVVKDEAFYLEEAQNSFEAGRFETALRAYGKVIEHNARNVTAWTGQVRMLIELGEFQEASLWADKALELFPDEPDVLAAKAVALARSGDTSAALTYSDSAVQAGSNGYYVWLARADVLLARKERRAEFCIDKALEMARQDWFVHWLASRICAYYKQFSRALKLAQQALALDATRAVVWLESGLCQFELGLAGSASNSFHQARQLDPLCRPPEETTLRLSRNSLWNRLRGQWLRIFRD